MSVADGNRADASIFNAAFLSKVTNSTGVAIYGLSNADPASGSPITNVQGDINTNKDGIASNLASIGLLDTRVTDLEANIPPASNLSATLDPTVNDSSPTYEVGSLWVNINNGRIFIAVDATAGASIWKRVDKPMLTVDQTYFNSSLSVSDSAWLELIADTGANEIRKIQSFYTTGSVAELGIGAAASESELLILQAGGNGETGLEVTIPPNSRLSIRLKSGEPAVVNAKLALNLFREA